MFETLETKIVPSKFSVVQDYGNQIIWGKSDEVYKPDFERIDKYIVNNKNLGNLVGAVFYPKSCAIRLSFKYNIHPNNTDRICHHIVFMHPPVDLLKILYKYIPNEVIDFILHCRTKYAIGELAYTDGSWLMAVVLGKRD